MVQDDSQPSHMAWMPLAGLPPVRQMFSLEERTVAMQGWGLLLLLLGSSLARRWKGTALTASPGAPSSTCSWLHKEGYMDGWANKQLWLVQWLAPAWAFTQTGYPGDQILRHGLCLCCSLGQLGTCPNSWWRDSRAEQHVVSVKIWLFLVSIFAVSASISLPFGSCYGWEFLRSRSRCQPLW